MKKSIAAGIAALALTLTACSDTTDETAATTEVETTVEETATSSATATATETPTSVIPETVQQQIEEAATVGRGPRPPLEEMTLLDGFGYVGIYMDHTTLDHYLCDARGYPSMDVMGDDGCSEPMEWGEVQTAFRDSMTRSFEREGLDVSGVPPAHSTGECIGYGCSPEQDAALTEGERNANAGPW